MSAYASEVLTLQILPRETVDLGLCTWIRRYWKRNLKDTALSEAMGSGGWLRLYPYVRFMLGLRDPLFVDG